MQIMTFTTAIILYYTIFVLILPIFPLHWSFLLTFFYKIPLYIYSFIKTKTNEPLMFNLSLTLALIF